MSSVAAPSSIAATFTSAYIVDRKTDVIWFLALPYAAVAIALLLREHLPGESVAAIALWVTVPHFFVTWLRVYGSPIEFNRWRERFVLGPVVIVLMAYVAILYAPLTLVLIFTLWDHQHSLMQQHGLARIYDFKAKAGTRSTKNFDLAFNWIFFVNMRTFMLEPENDRRLVNINLTVAQEDIDLLATLDPVGTPNNPSDEVLVPSDGAVISYRQHLKTWKEKGWCIDMETLNAKRQNMAFAIPCPDRRTSGNWVLSPVPLFPTAE